MDTFSNIASGFTVALGATNLIYCFVGVLLGTLIGVLPGIGAVTTISLLLPLTFSLQPETALIMLAGIYYGAQYGGSTTAILVNLPGEVSSVVTCLDGHKMANKGQAGPALAIAAISSLFAGCVATFIIAFFAPLLGEVAFLFGPAENFSLMVLGLTGSIVLAQGSLLRAFGMILLGLLLGFVGTDVNSGAFRYTFGFQGLADGIDVVVIAMGMFGIAEIIVNLEKGVHREPALTRISSLWPSRQQLRTAFWPMARGTGIGSLLGLLPGGGPSLASFAGYALEKKISKQPERFGDGAIEGLASPEAANNAGAQTSFIPMLTLGIPSNPVMALMIGALIVHGIVPGPTVVSENPHLFWGIVASMWIGNVLLLVLNLPMVGLWVKLLSTPYKLLFPAIILFSCIGAYSLSNSTFPVYLLALFGVAGYFFHKLGCEPAPLLLGFVLGPMMEENLRRALLLSEGNPATFVTHPLSLAFLLLACFLFVIVLAPAIKRGRETAFQE